MSTGPSGRSSRLAVGVTSDRLATVSPAARAVHRAILRGSATTGHAPDRAALADAVPTGTGLAPILAELHDRDVARLDGHSRVQVAYPFSTTPAAHLVTIEDGPTVYAMCAIDALGISAMLGTRVAIHSTDPGTGDPIRVIVDDGRATWEPDTAVVLEGSPAHQIAKPRRLPSARRALTPRELAEINDAARASGNDAILDALLLRLHTETACRRGGALALRRMDLDADQGLVRLRDKDETLRWQPISLDLSAHLVDHAGNRGAVAPYRVRQQGLMLGIDSILRRDDRIRDAGVQRLLSPRLACLEHVQAHARRR